MMKNSPHNRKHRADKAIREANQTFTRNLSKEHTVAPLGGKSQGAAIKAFNKLNSVRILGIYKQNLELASFVKVHKKSKLSITQLDASPNYQEIKNFDTKAQKNWMKHDLQKSAQIARKILKTTNKESRKAA